MPFDGLDEEELDCDHQCYEYQGIAEDRGDVEQLEI
jgi:hypothetical protein